MTTVKIRPSSLYAAAMAIALSALLAACASNKPQAEWSDPQFKGQSLRGTKVLVVCDASDVAIKRLCQDELARQVAAAGATPVPAPESVDSSASGGAASEKLVAAAREAGAKAVLAAKVAPDATVANPGPRIGIGVGGFGGSWGGGGIGTGVGVSVPVGGSSVNTAYGANVGLTDVDSGKLMWTSKVGAPASSDVNGQINRLAKAAVDAAHKAGFL